MTVKRVERGMPGHFCGSDRCCFHRCTDVGSYRVSTIGCYHPPGSGLVPQEIGWRRLFETMVFRTEGGEVADWSEIECAGYMTSQEAEAGHEAVVERYLAIVNAGEN